MRSVARLVVGLCVVAVCGAWNSHGHRTITELAVDLLPPEAPAWLRTPEVRAQIAWQSNEPDRWRGTKLAVLGHENNPDHFLDIELLDKRGMTMRGLPQLRYEFVAQLTRTDPPPPPPEETPRRGINVAVKDDVGFLPYSILEHQAKLMSSFNTLRILEQLNDPARKGQMEAARANVIHEMGQLSHFVGDAGQPLHTTIHHHGWVGDNPDGFTTERSFHQYIDGDVVALHGLDLTTLTAVAQPMRSIKADTVWPETLALIERSFEKMRPLYVLQKTGALQKEEGKRFIAERMTDAASVLSGLYWEAWQASAPTPQQVKDYLKYDKGEPVVAPVKISANGVDLRETLMGLGLSPRAQGARGTCSIFTTCSAIEFALAKKDGKALRLSPEYLNYVASQAAGQPSDGNFFHNALAGFEQHGICAEEFMPYQQKHDATATPSLTAKSNALSIRGRAKEGLAVRWIVPWQAARFGVDAAQFAEIKSVLQRGYPVAAGSGHSRLLVGFREDPSAAGGGIFLTQDSGLGRFDEVTFEFVRTQVADVFWVEALP